MRTILHEILARARSTPARPALQAEAGLTYLTFGDLAEVHRSFHARMAASGVKPGTAVGLRIADPIVETVAILALISCGATWTAPGAAHSMTITDAPAPQRAICIDTSWFKSDAPAMDHQTASAQMREAGVELGMESISGLVADAVTRLPVNTGVTTVCASRLDSIPVVIQTLATLATGGAVVFAAPDPGSLVQMTALSQARVAIAPAHLICLLADIMWSGEPLDLCFDAVLAQGPLTPEYSDALRRTCARHVIALA